MTYGELVGGRAFSLPVNANAKRKAAARMDRPRQADAACRSARDGHRRNWSTSTTCACPEWCTARSSGRPRSARRSRAWTKRPYGTCPGFIKVVVRKNFVGVVAEKPWQAIRAAAALKATWSAGSGLPRQADFYDYLRTQPSRDTLVVDSRDVDDTSSRAATIVKATYRHPYQMHGSMGSSCAVADVQADRVTVWSSTQSAYPTRSGVAMLLGVPVERVRVVFTQGLGLLRDQRRRHRGLRRGAAVARRRHGRCACSCRARTRWRGRTTGSPT